MDRALGQANAVRGDLADYRQEPTEVPTGSSVSPDVTPDVSPELAAALPRESEPLEAPTAAPDEVPATPDEVPAAAPDQVVEPDASQYEGQDPPLTVADGGDPLAADPVGAEELADLQTGPTALDSQQAAGPDVPTGARGPACTAHSILRRPEVRSSSWTPAKRPLPAKAFRVLRLSLERFSEGGPLDAPEQAMVDRLKSIAAGEMEPTSYDKNFYTHELDEAARYDALGLGPESGVNLQGSQMYEVWNNVHTAALEDYGISDADLFYPGLV